MNINTDDLKQLNGAKIKEFRTRQQLSQSYVADKLSVNRGTIIRWELIGDTDFTISTVLNILNAFPSILNKDIKDKPSSTTNTIDSMYDEYVKASKLIPAHVSKNLIEYIDRRPKIKEHMADIDYYDVDNIDVKTKVVEMLNKYEPNPNEQF